MPAHITILYPFCPPAQIDAAVIAKLAACFAAHPAFEFQLAHIGRLPGLLYLAPQPGAPIRDLTLAVWHAFPDYPPYEGRHADILPHLTVAMMADEQALAQVADGFADAAEACLPITTRVTEVALLSNARGQWEQVHSFALGAPNDP